MSWITASNQL